MQIDTAMNTHSKTPGGLNVAVIGVVGVIGVITLLVIVLASEAWFYKLQDEELQRNWNQPNTELQAYRETEALRLGAVHSRPVDPTKPDGPKAVVVPIDQAMEIIAKEGLQSAPK